MDVENEFADAAAGFGVRFPPAWEVHDGILGTSVAGLEPHHSESSFRSNANVVALPLDNPADAGFFERQLLETFTSLTDAVLIDVEDVLLAERPGHRVLIGHRDGPFSLTLEQWYLQTDEFAYTLSCTAVTHAYADASEVFAGIAESFGLR